MCITNNHKCMYGMKDKTKMNDATNCMMTSLKWKHFPRNWPFVRGIHRSPVKSPHKGQWRGALMFTLICARINGWVNNREAGDLRRHRAHYDVIVMWRHLKTEFDMRERMVQMYMYRRTPNISRTKSQNLNASLSSCSCLCPIHWNQVLSRERRYRRCSNYIWVINNFIAY